MATLADLDMPVVTIDLDIVEANIARLQTYLDGHGIKNRPHIKTHKIPAIAQKQAAAGAVGIACQKIGEAEVMAAAGIKDIMLPFNIIGPAKPERLMALARLVRRRPLPWWRWPWPPSPGLRTSRTPKKGECEDR